MLSCLVHDFGFVPTVDRNWTIVGNKVHARIRRHGKTFRFLFDKPAGTSTTGASAGARLAATNCAYLAQLPVCFALHFALRLLNLTFRFAHGAFNFALYF